MDFSARARSKTHLNRHDKTQIKARLRAGLFFGLRAAALWATYRCGLVLVSAIADAAD